MAAEPDIAEVVIPRSASGLYEKVFHYTVPEELRPLLRPGMRVRVPLGRQNAIGVVVGMTAQPALVRLRPVQALLDETEAIPSDLLSFTKRVSDNYFVTWGKLLKASLPPATKAPIKNSLQSEREGEAPQALPVEGATQAPLMDVSALFRSPGPRIWLARGGSQQGAALLASLVRTACRDGKRALVLVPDVGRLTRLAHLLGKPLPDRLATLYSELPVRRRASEWRRIQTGQATVVVGTRAALYAPLPSPEWVIVFEEQDSSYHLEESPKTHLRNLALARAKGCGGRAVLISSSPSVETDFHARTGDYEPLTLADRDTQPAPEIHTQPTGPRLCSDALSRAIGETLACGERVVLLLNRRGFSPAFVCPDCGEGFRCTRCSLSLVFHQAQRSMRCHACGLSQPPPVFCRRCRGTRLLTIGGGTERLEEELRRTFPNAPAVRLDGDTLRTPTQRKRWALEINEATADILIGTQLLFHVPLPDRIGLFGVLQADDPLHLPDYRAAEWCFLRLCRVLDKAAQAAPPARVLVQAFQPDHYLFTALAGGRRESFYDEELRLREALGFPPYATLLRLQFIGGTEGRVAEEAERFGKQLARRLDPSPGTDLLGPAPAPRRHIRGNYRYQILLKARSRYALLETIRKSLPALKGGLRSVKLEVDLDPASLL